jgi:hypothetical protein
MLTLYKNIDPQQPIRFKGDAVDAVLRNMQTWMDANSRDSDRDAAFGCDGLTCFLDPVGSPKRRKPDASVVVLTWDELYECWDVRHDHDVEQYSVDEWQACRHHFAQLVLQHGEWA